MHDTVTTSPTTTTYRKTSSNELLPPFTLSSSRLSHPNSLGWSQLHDSDGESSLEDWHLSTPDSTIHLTAIVRPAKFNNLPFSSTMPARTEKPTTDRGMTNGHRWRFNNNGQLVDSEAASAGWELADEIVRLKIGEVTGDADDVHVPIRTPPKSKLASAAVAQLADTSPLETSSNTSVGSSPHASDHPIGASHSRGSSTDTTISSSHESIGGNTLLTHPPFKSGASVEAKERPHSFSGGLSSADLRRLQQAGDSEIVDRQLQQQQQWAQNQYRESMTSEPSYPSLSNYVHRPQPQLPPNMYDLRVASQSSDRDEQQPDYPQQQRGYNAALHPMTAQAPPPHFIQGRPNNNVAGMAYRQPAPRGFPQQGLLPNPSALGYQNGQHTSHLSLGNTQQLYDMMLPGPPHDSHPAVTRVQQQHNVFRGTHHHSASDPSALRDAATLALLNNNLQTFGPAMFQPGMPPPPTMPLYPNQFYGAPDVAAMARLQAQYTGPYNVAAPNLGMDGNVSSPTSSSSQHGPSANNRKLGLYKTELCRSWEEKGTCRYGAKCQFAHGEDELRKVSRHPKYKTEICRTFWVSGSCPYGKRCCFIHTELPSSGAPPTAGTPGAESAPMQQRSDGRSRSMSTNSDPNEASLSLLARISAKSNPTASTPIDMNPNGFQFTGGRPPTGSLRVDTSALDGPSVKQNKSAYPSFASNGILLPAPEPITAKSPAPVTAGPDLGRHNLARMEIVGYNSNSKKINTSNSNPRHSFSGSEDFGPSPGHSFALSGENSHPRVNGHVRAGSAGNWGTFGRSSHLSTSTFPHGPSPAGEIMGNSPWSTTDLAVGSSRLNEKTWA